MKKTTRLVSTFAAALLPLSMAACGGGGESSTTTTPDSSGSTASTSGESTSGESTTVEKLDPNQTLEACNMTVWLAGSGEAIYNDVYTAILDNWVAERAPGSTHELTFIAWGDFFSKLSPGLAGGAAVAGCCAQMVGFAVMSFRENGWGGLVSQGLGTSMLQMPNIVKNPRIWIAPTLASAVTGPIATCVFRLQMNGDAINSGMGTCGLCGQLGVWTGWIAPSETALASGAAAVTPTAFDWAGLLLISFVLPAILAPAINQVCRRLGWVKDGDLKLS